MKEINKRRIKNRKREENEVRNSEETKEHTHTYIYLIGNGISKDQ
jgi:hypothetical protein